MERHNLAVYRHLMALSSERSSKQRAAQQTPATVDNCWREAIRWWNDIAAEPDLWHSVSELVSSLGDPRLDYRFARSLRDQFAYAFDQINVELAIDYAKTGREADAKHQVAYMELSQPGSDDVKGTFDDAFAGLLKQTEAVVDTALAETKAKPKDGLKQANAILAQTDEPLRVSRIVLEKGSPIRGAIVSAIFGGVRGCLIAYGNETKDWDECLKLTEKLKGIAETEEQRTKVEKDYTIISENAKVQNAESCCWCCKTHLGTEKSFQEVHMYGPLKMGSSVGEVRFPNQTICVPLCENCKGKTVQMMAVDNYPPIRFLLDHGWKIGSGPTQDEIRSFWGFPKESIRSEPPVKTSPSRYRDQSSETPGCVIAAMVIGGLIVLGAIGRAAYDDAHKTKSYSSAPPTTRSHVSLENRLDQERQAREETALWESRRMEMPANGTVRRYHTNKATSPLKVSTSNGSPYDIRPTVSTVSDTSSQQDGFLVKVVDKTNGKVVVDLFVMGGKSAEVSIPPGTYEIRYASGKEWYGYDYLFGPKTLYSKATRTFHFSEDSGFEITLYKVLHGNLATQSIRPEEF